MTYASPEAAIHALGGATEVHRPGAAMVTAIQQIALPSIGIPSLPPRPWAYGSFLMFGKPAVLGALDGGGKGAIAVVMALAMITGKPLLGERVWRTGPVAIVTYEDDEEEWHRRVAAACEHYQLDYEHALTNIRFLGHAERRINFAAPAAGDVIFPDGNGVIATLRNMGAILLIIDPLNHAHSLQDGNNNVMMARVAGMSRSLLK